MIRNSRPSTFWRWYRYQIINIAFLYWQWHFLPLDETDVINATIVIEWRFPFTLQTQKPCERIMIYCFTPYHGEHEDTELDKWDILPWSLYSDAQQNNIKYEKVAIFHRLSLSWDFVSATES